MGLSISFLLSACTDILRSKFFGLADNVETVIVRSLELDGKVGEMNLRMINFNRDLGTNQKSAGSDEITIEEFISFPNRGSEKLQIETTVSFKNPVLDKTNFGPVDFIAKDDDSVHRSKSSTLHSEPGVMLSQRTASKLDAAAIKLQKFYKSYRTRRNLADCAVVVEELWWKVLDFAALKRSSVLFFDIDKPETAVSRWARAGTRVAKVGKGLSKDQNARKLALQHWLEAIDPRHRYGHNLHLYYDFWFDSESAQPFFYWLDVGDGKEVNLEKCPRNELQHQCIKYLGPKEREAYEVVVDGGKLVYKQSGLAVDTHAGSKWIFVLSTSRSLYVGQKKKGVFQHSSFLAGAATTAAGRLVARNGILEAIWPYSGHYLPTEENFKEFINFLEDHHVDLTNVKRCPIDAESPSFRITDGDNPSGKIDEPAEETNVEAEAATATATPAFDLGKLKLLSCKWSTGAGPRIGCVRDYPTELRFQALEHVNLSPRSTCGPFGTGVPIPSPRPSPKVRLSPRLSYMGIPSPRASVPK